MRFYYESISPAKFLTLVHEVLAEINNTESIYLYVDDENYNGECRICSDVILSPALVKSLRDRIISNLKEKGVNAHFGEYEDVSTLGSLNIEPPNKV